MTKRLQVYKCGVCGNITNVLHESDGTLVCCNQPMNHLAENTTDAAQEKHVPVLERAGDGWKVTVGSVSHPMGDDHYIEWIELLADGNTYVTFLKPGDIPVAVFNVSANNVTARAYCNLHGLWKS